MPTYYARKAGNINAADVWATTPSGTAAAVTFASGDVLMANSFTITVNVSTNLGTGQIRNDTFGGATTGGQFNIANNVTLTSNIITGGGQCVVFSAASPAQCFIVGNISGTLNLNQSGVRNDGTGTITIQGNITGTSGASSNTSMVWNSSTGTLNIQGNVTGGSSSSGTCNGVLSSGGTLTIQGNITGGSASSTNYGVSAGGFTHTGNVSGGSLAAGINHTGTATSTILGNAIGGSSAAGAINASTGTLRVTRAVGNAYGPGNTAGLASAVGAANSGLGVIEIEQLEYGTYGMSPTSGTGIRLKKANTNVAVFNYADTAGAKTLIDATQNAAMPAATDVRSGVSYASGALSGTCAVPAAGSVSLGVPVGAGFGTAVLTPEAVWGAATRTLTSASGPTAADNATAVWAAASRTITGGTVDTLTNAPSVPSAATIASQVRTELSVELARIDAATSTRATPANIPTADIAAIKVKTDALNTTRLAQVSTTEILGNLLAQANS
jgi:hypothetical protein